MSRKTEREFQSAMALLEKLKADKSRAEGRYQALLDDLKRQFGCDSLAQAKKLLLAKTSEAQQAEALFEREWEEFHEEWGERIAEFERSR